MNECIRHYTWIFNFSTLVSNMPSTWTHSHHSFAAGSKQHSSFSFTTKEPISLLDPQDEKTILDSGLLEQISAEKINFQLTRMSTMASCGSDDITVMMLRVLLDISFTQYLFQLYYTCLRKGQTPKRWNEACIFPLCKDKTKPYTASNSRPISLLCLFR